MHQNGVAPYPSKHQISKVGVHLVLAAQAFEAAAQLQQEDVMVSWLSKWATSASPPPKKCPNDLLKLLPPSILAVTATYKMIGRS